MIIGVAFTLWFIGANGHMTEGDIYRSEKECTEVSEAFDKAHKEWLIDSICIMTGGGN